MTEADMKIEARLTAIEYILSDLCAKWYVTVPTVTMAKIEAAHTDTLERLSKQSFPGIDAALSDAFSAELEDSVGMILRMQREMLAGLLAKLGR